MKARASFRFVPVAPAKMWVSAMAKSNELKINIITVILSVFLGLMRAVTRDLMVVFYISIKRG